MKTITFIAKARDKRCNFWAVRIPVNFGSKLDLNNTTSLKSLGYLRYGADIELIENEAVLTSEAIHHSKNRGYNVQLHFVFGEKMYRIQPSLELKKTIKELATDEEWMLLKDGSGDITAALRFLKATRIFDVEKTKKLLELI